MSILIWLAAVAVYLTGFAFTAVRLTRFLGERERCHGTYGWGDADTCRRFDPPGCWHANDQASLMDALIGSACSVLWPLVLVPFTVWLIAKHRGGSRLLSADDLERLEREAGIR